MYDVRDLGSLLIFIAVSPLFLVVFLLALLWLVPLLALNEAYRWLDRQLAERQAAS